MYIGAAQDITLNKDRDGEFDYSPFCIVNGNNKSEGGRSRVYSLNSGTDKMR